MRIAQVSPLYESVPPQMYGGTERVVSFLTEELVERGHDVTLYASGDSRTAAKLVPMCTRSLRLDDGCVDSLAHHFVMLERLSREFAQYDIVHFHIDYLHFLTSRALDIPNLTTLHGRLDMPDLQPLYASFPDMPVVSISNAQRAPLPDADWVATVQHGLPVDLLPFTPNPDEYLSFVGRISPEKRVDRAIEIATALGMKLRIAAKIADADKKYFETEIEHLFHNPLVEFVGEISETAKAEFVGKSRALLFPIDWPEPFGLVMIEAMACGTPVIAMDRGSVREVVDDGVTGFVVDDVEGAIAATRRVGELDRARVRRVFEERFSAARMARDYVEIYERLLRERSREGRIHAA
jgi:glycosyltransferase involved in cell wall biosynthesis